MKVVGQRGGEWFLIHLRGEGLKAKGRIWNSRTGERFPETNFQTLLAQGYWEEPSISRGEQRSLIGAAGG